MRDARTKVAGWVDRITGRAAERQSDRQHQQSHRQRAKRAETDFQSLAIGRDRVRARD